VGGSSSGVCQPKQGGVKKVRGNEPLWRRGRRTRSIRTQGKRLQLCRSGGEFGTDSHRRRSSTPKKTSKKKKGGGEGLEMGCTF